MAAITAKDVAALRAKTGIGMMECKKALVEADGDMDAAVKILREKAATVSVQPVGVRLIVGGRNRKGVFTMTMMGSVDGYEPQTQSARKGAYLIKRACSHTDVAPWLEEEVKPQAANWHSLDDVAHTLDGCIAKMAKLDKSINTTYFRQLVM